MGKLLQTWLKAKRGDNSFGGEYAHLRKLLSRLRIQEGTVVDIAASDGVNQSCTLGFFSDPQWKGLAVEMDPDRFARLAFVYAEFENARLARCRVTPDNVVNLLLGNEVPADFTLLNLDIDSYDLRVMEQVLGAGFLPQVISMEVNEKIPPPLFFAVNFDDAHHWKGDHFYGCSLNAASQVVKSYGYDLESLQFNNAFFVKREIGEGTIADQSVEDAYNSGYRNRPERERLFPWNSNVNAALMHTPEENLVFFRNLFKDYEGQFTLKHGVE